MFITQQLNTISELVEGQGLSDHLQHLLEQQYLNLEATLLRAKVLRDFSSAKVQYIVQSAIQAEHAEVAFLFAPFILANLNHPVIYSSPATPTVLNILNRYYQAEQKQNLKIDDMLEALNVYLDLSDSVFNDVDFFYFSFSVHDKFHRTLVLSGFFFLKIASTFLNSSFFPKPIKRRIAI